MVRPKKYGENTVAIACRIPENLFKKVKIEGLNVGEFLTKKLEEKYFSIQSTPQILLAYADPTTIKYLADHWTQFEHYISLTRPKHADHESGPDWGPDNPTVDPFVDSLSGGKVKVTRGWIVRNYRKVREEAHRMGKI